MEIIINIIIGVCSAIVASWMYEKFQERRERKPLNDILNFGRKDTLIFVCPSRTDIMLTPQLVESPPRPSSLHILPWTATEDFLAINNIKSAVLKIHWDGKDNIKQPDRIEPNDKVKSIFCIGSSKSNSLTEEIENLISPTNSFYRVRKKDNSGEYEIWDGTQKTSSPTYDQLTNYKKSNPQANLSELSFTDFGYITKITNPFNERHNTKIYIIAGIRGIGTWGAAECLKKEWKQIYDQLILPHRKDSNFSALIRITYKGFDIKEFKVVNVNPLSD